MYEAMFGGSLCLFHLLTCSLAPSGRGSGSSDEGVGTGAVVEVPAVYNKHALGDHNIKTTFKAF